MTYTTRENLVAYLNKLTAEEYNPFILKLLDPLLAQLKPFGKPSRRESIVGYRLFVDDTIFGLNAGPNIYLRCDASNRRDFELIGSKPLLYYGKRKSPVMSYWFLPWTVYRDRRSWLVWVDKALAVTRNAQNVGKKAKKVPDDEDLLESVYRRFKTDGKQK
ncbi:MAG: TfoX/Sxy family protein [Alphaproteobacteria bacterium]|nr:TfoX/Sxy family protein [Alphaproteobacteria bacterium]